MIKPRILLVDDDLNLLASFRRQFCADYEIVMVGDGPSAVEAVRAAMAARMPFAVVLCDMQMPGMNGVATLKAIRDLAPDSARLMLTGSADLQTSMEAINQGNVLRFFVKPCPIETLREGLLAGVEHHRLANERLGTVENAKHWAKALAVSNAEIEQFAYVAAHDLQEPLRIITSYVQLLKQRYGSKLGKDADEFIDLAVDGTHRMRRLFVDFLKYSEICRQELDIRSIDTNSVVARVLAKFDESINETKAVITVETLPHLDADEKQITILFENLIANAIEFRKADIPPIIRIAATRSGDHWNFAVADNGIGIGDEFKDRVFDLFERLHESNGGDGTGIGLALCKKIVERHNGTIWLQPSDCMSTVFLFTLPTAK